MKQRQPPIYHSCLQLSRLVFSITRHFPKKANYEEGAELRRASVEAVGDRDLRGGDGRGVDDGMPLHSSGLRNPADDEGQRGGEAQDSAETTADDTATTDADTTTATTATTSTTLTTEESK